MRDAPTPDKFGRTKLTPTNYTFYMTLICWVSSTFFAGLCFSMVYGVGDQPLVLYVKEKLVSCLALIGPG